MVTGASGNTGTALLRRLHREPAVEEIVAVCRRPPRPAWGALGERVRWVGADVAVDDLAGAAAGVDAVVHLAWLIRPSHSREDLDRVNVAGTRRVLAAGLAGGARTFLVASSIAAYSPAGGRRADESWPTDGLRGSLYSRQKVAVERILDRLERERPDVRVIRSRPAAICQRQAASQIVRHFLGPFVPRSLLLRPLLPVLPWPGRLSVQVVHADDVADAYATALLSDARGAFNLADEPPLSGPDLARILGTRTVRLPPSRVRAAVALAWRARLLPTEPGWVDLLCAAPQLDAGRARRELGWSPKHDAGETVRELVEAMERREVGPTPSLARVRGHAS